MGSDLRTYEVRFLQSVVYRVEAETELEARNAAVQRWLRKEPGVVIGFPEQVEVKEVTDSAAQTA